MTDFNWDEIERNLNHLKLKIGGFEKRHFLNPSIFNLKNQFILFVLLQIMGLHGWDSMFMITMVSSQKLGVRKHLQLSVCVKHEF